MEKQSNHSNHKEMQSQENSYVDTQSTTRPSALYHCGSVDDGKNTPIGRMLYEAQMTFED